MPPISRVAILFVLFLHTCTARGDTVDFQRDIRPILADHCANCHGTDENAREAGLRLDAREHALAGGDSGEAAIVPGHPDRGELMSRVRSDDPDAVMPPPDGNNPLSAEQIRLLEQWIRQGADYATHWAFTPPVKVALADSRPNHPIDNLVSAQLARLRLQASSPTDNNTLCRRLYLDLIGLPPSPEDRKRFQRDGFEATLEALLKDERFGEKWARHWLDAARYSDTNGYEKDRRRDQWAWRDWVVNALNRDMPYDQFIIEQIAGDLLPAPTQQQIIATGFLRNSMLNEEGAIVPEQFRMFEMFDRMDCLGKAVLGLTTQCAQCHTHKFDPLTQDEYYGMFAYLNDAYEAQSWVYTDDQLTTIEEIHESVRRVESRLRDRRPQWQQEVQAWEREVLAKTVAWTYPAMTELGSISGLNHPVQLTDKSILMLGHTSSDVFFVSAPELSGVTGLRLEALNHGDLPHRGPGRSSLGTWDIQELEVFVREPGAENWEKRELTSASADFSQPEQKSDKGKAASGPVRFLIDGVNETVWKADRGKGRRNQPSVAVVRFAKPLDVPRGTQFKLALRMGNMLGCCRVGLTRQPDPVAPPVDHASVLAMSVPASQRSAAQQAAIFTAWRKSLPDADRLNEEIAAQWGRLPDALTTVLHLAPREHDKQRITYVLDRGEWDRPKRSVKPHTPASLHPLQHGDGPARLAFARWLMSERSPLTARVEVNRVWQAIFGVGLVETPEDFGTRADVPEYRELLDWLAVDLTQNGWSRKHLIRTIVTSSTYQQSSHVSDAQLERDPVNRLLARGPRFRCDAEVVRDIALSASGLIEQRLGGPPVIPPVPQNVLDYNYTYPGYWKPNEGRDRYRRTLYGFRKRSMPDPVMSSFDGPNGDISCVRRIRSNTPIAALASLNETVFFEAAQALALRVLREGGSSDADRADYAFQLCTCRAPVRAELEEILSLLESRRERLSDGWLNPRQIATGDAEKLPQLPPGTTPQDAAAWTIVARVLLNLDETISKN